MMVTWVVYAIAAVMQKGLADARKGVASGGISVLGFLFVGVIFFIIVIVWDFSPFTFKQSGTTGFWVALVLHALLLIYATGYCIYAGISLRRLEKKEAN